LGGRSAERLVNAEEDRCWGEVTSKMMDGCTEGWMTMNGLDGTTTKRQSWLDIVSMSECVADGSTSSAQSTEFRRANKGG